MAGGPVANQIVVPGRTKVWLADVGTTAPATATATPNASEHVAAVTAIAAGGTGYVVNDTITLTGGTSTAAAVLTVTTVSSGAVTAASITTPGNYSVAPTNPVAQGSSSGSGTGATFTLRFGGWYDVGYTTEDATQVQTNPNFTDVRAAQSDFPVRTFQVSDDLTIQVDLIQWNADNFVAAFGGGAISGTTPNFVYTPPTLGARKERACMIDVTDGSKVYRYIFPRTLQKEGVTQALNRGGESKLPLRLTLLGSDSGTPWTLLTTDTAFTSATLT